MVQIQWIPALTPGNTIGFLPCTCLLCWSPFLLFAENFCAVLQVMLFTKSFRPKFPAWSNFLMHYELLFLLKSAALLHWAYKAFIMEGLLRCSCPTERKTEISPPGKAAQLEMRGVVFLIQSRLQHLCSSELALNERLRSGWAALFSPIKLEADGNHTAM